MRALSWADALSRFSGDGLIYLAGNCGEPSGFLDALDADPELAAARTFTGVWIPGVNRRDPTHPESDRKFVSTFATPSLMGALKAGRAEIQPLHYTDTYRWLRDAAALSCGVVQVPPPRNGTVGLGIAADFVPAVEASGAALIAQINGAMPDVANGPRYPVERFAAFVEEDSALITYTAGPLDDTYRAIGQRVARLIRDGDHVQFGLGKLQGAVLESLRDRRELRLHGGMIAKPFPELLDTGSFESATIGVALGDLAFYRAIAADRRVAFRPVQHTHSAETLSSLKSFVSVNSILQVDLFGQGNGEFIGNTQVSGHGGLIDFMRGARLSRGGRSILALPSTAKSGTQTRIVPSLAAHVPVTVPRSDVDWVVTEYGAANLRYATVEERAMRLIEIAAPHHRDALANAWDDLRRKENAG